METKILKLKDDNDWRKDDSINTKIELKDIYKNVQNIFEYYFNFYKECPRWIKETLGGDCYKNIKYILDGVVHLYFSNRRDDVKFHRSIYLELEKFEFGMREMKRLKKIQQRKYTTISSMMANLSKCLTDRIAMLIDNENELDIEK